MQFLSLREGFLTMRKLLALIAFTLLAGSTAGPVNRPGRQAATLDHACRRYLPKASRLPATRAAPAEGLALAAHTLILDESSAQLAANAGFTAIVQPFPWKDLQPTPATFAFGVADAMVDNAERHDLALIVRLDMPPEWARREDPAGLPFTLDAYRNFVASVAARYAGRIAAYIIWNEPNLAAEWSRSSGDLPAHYESFAGWVADPAEYAGVLGVAFGAIRQADPDALVVASGLAPTNERSPRALDERAFLSGLYAAGWQACFDVLAVHDYGFGLPAAAPAESNGGLNLARVSQLRRIMLAHGDERPIWITELGYTIESTSHPPVSRQEQATYLVDAYRRTQQEWPWISLFTVWNLALDRPAPDEMGGYSIVEPDGTPRPAYEAIVDLVDERN